ncbi:MAG: hypothetical protein AB7G11_02905 [Phycisphaerales bacterium]
MRVPLSKVYRAFPELDGFPDSECERFVLAARTQSGCGHAIAVGGLGLFVLIMYFVVMRIAGGFVGGTGPGRVLLSETGDLVLLAGLIIGGPVAACMSSLVLRDWLLRRAIFARIHLARCTQCKFSLLGLPTSDGQVRCPECGNDIVLAQIGLKPEDLLVRRSAPGA